jgi:hypothetical protein
LTRYKKLSDALPNNIRRPVIKPTMPERVYYPFRNVLNAHMMALSRTGQVAPSATFDGI